MTAENNSMDALLALAPVVPVLAIADVSQAVPLARALVKGGLRVIEITLRTACALDAIKLIADQVEGAIVGAGTVLTGRDLDLSKAAGARFAVSPGATPALLSAASHSGLPFLPGVASPSEIMVAREHGFSILKFFPAEAAGGIAMLKSFAGPFAGVKFCPTGGISEDSLAAYLTLANVIAVGGTWLAPADLLASKSWDAIEALAARSLKLAGRELSPSHFKKWKGPAVMYRENPLKRKLIEGQQAVSFWLHLASPIAAEIMSLVGYDGAVIDLEHGPIDYLGATTLMQAMSGTATSPIIRVPWNDPVEIKRALDTGTEGIMVPEVNSVAEAEALVSACLYPPQGKRGAASVLNRASSYGLDNVKYLEENGKELLVIAQIESLEAVANIEQIAAVDGIDVLFIGPNDLSGDCGKVGDYSNPIFIEALAKAEDIIKKSNKFLGGLPRVCDTAGAMLQRGYDFVISASDVLMLRDAALQDLKSHRELSA